MGTLGRAIFTVGKWICGTGQVMDRLGSTLQGGLRAEEKVSRHRTIMNIFEKEPRINEDVFVAPSAAVIGDIEIGHGSSIWYGSVERIPIRRQLFQRDNRGKGFNQNNAAPGNIYLIQSVISNR